MSYEGYTTYICQNGHGHQLDASAYLSTNCPRCEGKWIWFRETDQTNGYYEENPETHSPKMLETGFEDVWHKDHYGNRYATKILLLKPDPADALWQKIQV